MKKLITVMASIAICMGISSCKKKTEEAVNTNCFDVNVLSKDQDLQLGAQVAAQIAGTPAEYPILDSAANPKPYVLLNKIRDKILNAKNSDGSDAVSNKSKFVWRLKVINDNKTLNAFCTPGGYIYVYTGLIKYLDSEDDLAGVMGHEMAHADLRHSTDAITQQYGLDFVLSMLSGSNPNLLVQIATQLGQLKYSRCHESQADEASVVYLSGTKYYKCNGAGSFFAKLIAEGQTGGTPTFLSTHPSPENRVKNIDDKASKLACNTSQINTTQSEYQAVKNSLP